MKQAHPHYHGHREHLRGRFLKSGLDGFADYEVLPYDPRRVEEASRHFDETVRRIQAREFAVTTPPEAAICKECDLKMLCHAEGIIQRSEAFA